MVTENNSQINTFTKGMNSDTSYSMLLEGLYVYANNVRMFQIDNQDLNGQGEIKAVEGIKSCLKLLYDVDKILAATSIRDIGVIIIKHTSGIWSVYKFKNHINEDGSSDEFKASDFHEVFKSIEETNEDSFSVVCRYEDTDNIKLYIADGKNSIMIINLANDYGTQSINNISSNPTINLFPPIVELVIDGKLKTGMVSYAYRLYYKYGQSSEISPATRMYPVVNKKGNLYEGADYGKETNCGFKIKIDIKNHLLFDHIEIYRISYNQTGQQPFIELISDIVIKENENVIYYNDTGISSLKNITLEEFNTYSGIHIIPKIIESKNDYMFASSIKNNNPYEDENIKKWDSRAYSFDSNGVCELYSYSDDTKCITITSEEDMQNVPKDFDCFDKNNDLSKPYQPRYDLKGHNGGSGLNISWEFTYKDVLLSKNQYGFINSLENGYGDPMIASKYKSLRRGELYRYGIILYLEKGVKSDVKWIADIRVPEYDFEAKRSDYTVDGETYNFNIVQYKSGVYGRSIGVLFKVKNLPNSVIGYEIVRCNRSVSDIKSITQGVLSRPVKCWDATTIVNGQPGSLAKIYPYMPTGYLTTAWFAGGVDYSYRTINYPEGLEAFNYEPKIGSKKDSYHPYYDNFENTDVYQFVSPESTYLKDSTISIIDNNSYLNLVKYIYPQYSNQIVNNGENGSFLFLYIRIGDNMNITIPKINPAERTYKNILIDSNNKSVAARLFDNTEDTDKFHHIQSQNGNEHSYIDSEWYNIIPFAYQYCCLFNETNNLYFSPNNKYGTTPYLQDLKSYKNKIKIKDIKISTEGSWNGIYESKDGKFMPKYDNGNINIGNNMYCNYVLGTLYGIDFNGSDSPLKSTNNSLLNGGVSDNLTASGGRCFVLLIEDKDESIIHRTIGSPDNINGIVFNGIYRIDARSIAGTYVCNIQHDVIPYNGNSLNSIESSSYYSYGDFFDSDNVYADVFDGDCYPTVFEYVSAHKVFSGEGLDKQFCTSSIIYEIPIESNINTFLTNGFEFRKNYKNDLSVNLQIEPSLVSTYLTQDKELYRYNSVYSSYSTHNPYVSESDEVKYNTNNDCRVYFSEMKSNNENIDNWTKFKASNYIDVDSRYGAITALKDFKNILFFWLENATGRLASKERSVVTDINNIQLALGTGDILERYDYIDYIHGLHKDQFCLAESNETLYWFDEHNQAIRATSDGQSVHDLTMSAGVSNYMHKYELQNKNPKLFFDKKYNELISSVLDNRSIIYNQNYKTFTSFVDIPFDASISFNNGTYVIRNNNGSIEIAQWNCKQDYPKGWNDEILNIGFKYVINKYPMITKVFDNQEIITSNKPYSENKIDKSIYEKMNYSWHTDINKSLSTLEGKITDREGNFRYAIPRANNSMYGDRIRGKYMICEIEGKSNYDTSISYILTKFRTSFS